MKKKQIIGLGTLLLVLLLGLSTICYADTGVTLTDIKNYCYNIGFSQSNIDSFDWSRFELDLLASNHIVLNDNSGAWIYLIKGSYNNNYIYTNSGNYNSGNALYSSNGNSNCVLYRVTNSNGIFTSSWSQTSTIRDKFYTNVAFRGRWSNSWHDITGYTMPYMRPTTLFDGPYQDSAPFSFVPKPADSNADVYYFEDVPLYNASGEDLYLGQLFVPSDSNIAYWTKDNYYYRYNDWNLRQLPSDSFYLDYYYTDNDVVVYDVYLKSNYIYENTIYSSVWADDSTEPYTLAIANFYIKNNYTSVVNGVLDTSLTFSGDYKDKYDNEIQNEQDINNISEAIIGTILDDSEVDNILHNFDTSGEVAAYFGYHDYTSDSDSPYYRPSLLITSVAESLIDELMRSGDRYVDITLPNGEQERIWARYFTTPDEGRGSAWILFVRWYLIFVTIYLLYRNLLEIGEQFSTLNIHGAINEIDVDRYVFRM